MVRSIFAAVVTVAIALSLPAQATCTKPSPAPTVPDGATATIDQMKAGNAGVKAYVSALAEFQSCLENEIANAPKDTKLDVKQGWRDEANAAVDESQALAASFSAQIKIFKARPQQ